MGLYHRECCENPLPCLPLTMEVAFPFPVVRSTVSRPLLGRVPGEKCPNGEKLNWACLGISWGRP